MEAVIVERPEDLKPFDMLDQGIFIKTIYVNRPFPDSAPYFEIEAGPCEIVDRPGPNNQAVKYPSWGKLFYYPVKFPVTVMRGVLSDQSRT